ncbi:hypothetical protein MUK42_35424 [Musa troglodytarum]|uniref:Uncharacterized protein n=1 Tax=Musa troglodytarum TaxID=320322 RepID=A0A9E7JBG2_9LILI|nr:hypothetical protein MUK42_35424 [Musa troglodytarum]
MESPLPPRHAVLRSYRLLWRQRAPSTGSFGAAGKPGSAGSPLMRTCWDTKLAMAHADGMRRGASTPATEGFAGRRCGRKSSRKGSTTVLNRDTFSEEVFFSPDRSSLAC